MTKWLVQEVDGERSRECQSRSEADTRAKKRALSDATGVGIVAVEEMKNRP